MAKEKEDKPAPPRPKIKLVYIGPCTLADKKPGVKFVTITDEQLRAKRLPEKLPNELFYGGTIAKMVGRPGSVYSVEYEAETFEEKGLLYGNTRSYAGFLDNDPRTIEWQANHDAFHAAKILEAQEKKGKNKNLIQEQLAPLKVAYNRMVGHQRAVFLAQIIGYVTGRVTKEDLKIAEGEDDED